MDYQIVKNKFGYYEIENKPDAEFLVDYYQKKYFSDGKGKLNQYQKSYTDEEVLFKKNGAKRKMELLYQLRPKWRNTEISTLDVGCGEGWNLKYFKDSGSMVTGVEYQSEACESINPDLKEFIIAGNVWDSIDTLIKDGKKFNVIILDNVLEHVIYPEERVVSLKKLLTTDGILIIEVPNDYSVLHQELKERGNISKDFWLAPPDHLSYFSLKGLNALLQHSGYQVLHESCDYPIDMNLYNSDTNYVEDKTKGRNVHLSRVAIENLFDSISVELTNQLYSTYAQMGLGRNIVGYYSVK